MLKGYNSYLIFVSLQSFAYDPPESEDAIMRLAPRRPVTQASITSLKTKALRRTKTRAIDPETNDFVKPSFVARTVASIRAPFTKHWWQDRLEKTEGEILVDGNLLVRGAHSEALL